jgi:hypothetical protein
MHLLINNTPLDLSPDFAIEMEERNPFFSEVGAQSLPMQLPFSPHNLALLGRPERIAGTLKLNNEHDAIIRHGMFQKSGQLHIFSANKENGIDATFYINDGEFYTKIKDVHMEYINFTNDPDYNPDPFTGTPAQKAAQWMQRFEAVQRGQYQAPYAIFPVCTNIEEKTDDNNNKYYDYEYLNLPNLTDVSQPGLYPLVGYEERTVNDVQCPVGYGITPFLYLRYTLQMLFKHFGYELQPSLFDTDDNLSKIVLLNNNADTICAGNLDYRQLLPDCSVTTFLDALRNKFCCEFIPDGRSKTVHIHFFQHDALVPDMDLSDFVIDKPLITHEPFKQLRLSAATGIQLAQPAADTMERLLKDYNYSSALNEYAFANIQVAFNEIFLRKATGQFYKQVSGEQNINLQPIGSCLFNYDKQTEGLDHEERNAGDEQIPVLLQTLSENETLLFPLIGQRKHLNTGIKRQSGETEEDSSGKTNIMLAFNVGLHGWLTYGTPYCYDPQGEHWGDLSLQYAGNNGLFVRFWKKYDACLRHAFRKITCRLQIPLAAFLKFNIFTPKLLNGTPVLPVAMKYDISNKGLTVSEIEFRSLRLQLPCNLDAEQEVPGFSRAPYYWETKNNIIQLFHDNPHWNFLAIVTSPPPPAAFDAPTQQQFLDNETIPLGQFIMKIYYDHYDPDNNTWEHITTETPYTAWLEPRTKS